MMGIAQKVAREFSDSVRSRGQSYFAKNRVVITASSAGEVVARVRGTEKYKVRLRLRGIKLIAACSCPYFGPAGAPCKHLWATVLAADARGLLAAAPARHLRLITGPAQGPGPVQGEIPPPPPPQPPWLDGPESSSRPTSTPPPATGPPAATRASPEVTARTRARGRATARTRATRGAASGKASLGVRPRARTIRTEGRTTARPARGTAPGPDRPGRVMAHSPGGPPGPVRVRVLALALARIGPG